MDARRRSPQFVPNFVAVRVAVCLAVVFGAGLIGGAAVSTAQDWGERPLGPNRGNNADLDPAIKAWAATVKQRAPVDLTIEPAIRSNLAVAAENLYFTRRMPDAIDDGANGGPEDGNEDGPEDGNENANESPVQAPMRWAIFRLPIAGANADEAATREQQLAPVGPYPFAFFLLDPHSRVPQIVCIRQIEDTNGDGRVTESDDRSLWLGNTDGSEWRKIHTGSPNLTLAGVLQSSRKALILEPQSTPFVSRISKISLSANAANGPVEPEFFTEGIFVECIDPAEEFVVVTRLGKARAMDERFGMRRAMNWQMLSDGAESAEMAILTPPDHVKISLANPAEETVVISGEEWMRVAFVAGGTAFIEVMALSPAQMGTGEFPHPLLQSCHTLDYMEIESQTRIPITSDWQFDDQFVGPLPGRGLLYSHNTHISRKLFAFVEKKHHIEVAEQSPMTFELRISPDGSQLVYFEYADDAKAPFSPFETPCVVRSLSLRAE